MVRDRDRDYVRPLWQKLFRRAIADPPQLLQHQHFFRHPKRVRAAAVLKLENPKRWLTLKDMQLIIYKRFGSLTEIGQPIRNHSEVARLLRIHPNTVRKMVGRFLTRGGPLEKLRLTQPRYRMLSADLRETLLSKPLLLKWAAFSIPERVCTIKRLFGVDISSWTLRHFYKAHNVDYLQPKTVYRKALATRAELDPRRSQMAAMLA